MPGSDPIQGAASHASDPPAGPAADRSPLRLHVVGIGGVGGYFGGLLARRYADDLEVEVRFLARGENLRRIAADGLRVINPDGEFTANPALATDDPVEAGPADVILLCTKSYDLEGTLDPLRPCLIPGHTLVVPTLNGVDARDRIEALLPGQPVTNGCVYITSRLVAPGVVENFARNQKMFFGRVPRPGSGDVLGEPAAAVATSDPPTDLPTVTGTRAGTSGIEEPFYGLSDRLDRLQALARAAGIEATHAPDIAHVMWRKYLFISSMATATCYFDCMAGDLAAPGERQDAWLALYREVRALAAARGVYFGEEVETETLRFLSSLPPETTSSMHSDFLAGKPMAEVDTLSAYVVRASHAAGLRAPTYERMVPILQRRLTVLGGDGDDDDGEAEGRS